ncbi:MAG TPA: hypothetical protein VF179_04175 [Thermoanaerobaculia bacterium]|nr:hypothetical protein [Thermoanaerobaculia bacterium]
MKRSRLALLLVLGGALLAGAPPGRAQPPGLSVGKITVHGGQAVREVPGGVLLDRGCTQPDSPVQPFAAALGDSVELDVLLIACPPAELPPARCRLAIGENLSPWIAAEGAQVKIPVPLPDLTGIHSPELHCEAAGQALPPLETTLYLTYARPRPIVDPPHEVWYERACSWGAGFGRSATEREVANTILNQLYEFGQRRWRYATCTISGSVCILGATSLPTGELLCNFPDHLCKSHWDDLVEGDANRNFADCYIFSQVMQYIAATMGVGGMVPHQTFGSHRLGFVTHATARALDPEFTGNLMCGERQAPCAYTFYNHDLRRWGHLVYDATFGGIYHHSDELFSQSVTQFTDFSVTFEQGGACFKGTGYGGFPSFVEAPEAIGTSICADIEGGVSLAEFSRTQPSLVEPPAGELAVQVEVEIQTPGTYVVSGGLYEKDGTTPVTLRSSYHTVKAPAQTTVSGSPGTHPARLIFSGEDVARSGYRGPYRLHASLQAAGAPVPLDKLDAIVSGTILREDLFFLVGNPAKLGNPRNLDLAWEVTDSGRRFLRATIPVHVKRTQPAFYGIDARLSRGETTLAYGGGKVKMDSDTSTLTVDFDLAELPAPGTCDLALSLHWLDPVVSPLGGLMTEVHLPQLPAANGR